jgi:hypothetical protein
MPTLISIVNVVAFFGIALACNTGRFGEPVKSFERRFYGWLTAAFAALFLVNLVGLLT